mmetsp:Transcript_11894/g.35456  ORF Transcript_11894/g.35456 Transcript_11894/m.35456 type:complete len:199 (+) Transcript_11894:100-696(+)
MRLLKTVLVTAAVQCSAALRPARCATRAGTSAPRRVDAALLWKPLSDRCATDGRRHITTVPAPAAESESDGPAPARALRRTAGAVAAAAACVLLPTHASARDGAAIFEASCAACHAGGGNIVQRGKTLDRAALTANGIGDVDAIATLVSLGKRQMPGFGEACAPKPACTFGPRLAEDDVRAVAAWVNDRADDGQWPPG